MANFSLNSANGVYRVQFYGNTTCDASGNGEGAVLLGTQNVTVAANTFTGFSSALAFGTTEQITAIATSDPNNNGNFDDDDSTSEFSACRAVNTLPTITPQAGNTRQQGSPVSNTQIAVVNDIDQTENTLVVTVNGGATATVNGVTVSNIVVSAAGAVTADVVASCTATAASFTLRVTDTNGAFNEATLNVAVTLNTAPTVGTYPNVSLPPGGGTTVTPSAAPADNGSIASATAAAPSFTGTFSVNPTTGVVTISNANPPGTYTVMVTFTDNCGSMMISQFTLMVIAPPTIGTYPATMVVVGSNTTVVPNVAPTSATSISVSTNSNFKGVFVADPITGVVRITNAHPAGTYTVTVKALTASE